MPLRLVSDYDSSQTPRMPATSQPDTRTWSTTAAANFYMPAGVCIVPYEHSMQVACTAQHQMAGWLVRCGMPSVTAASLHTNKQCVGMATSVATGTCGSVRVVHTAAQTHALHQHPRLSPAARHSCHQLDSSSSRWDCCAEALRAAALCTTFHKRTCCTTLAQMQEAGGCNVLLPWHAGRAAAPHTSRRACLLGAA